MPRISAVPCAIAVCLIILSVVLAGCESPPARVAENGSVRILSSPSGAEIYLDAEYRGTTPATVSAIPAGSHTLEIRTGGYDRWSSPVTVKAGGITNITALLTAIPVTPLPVTYATAAAPAEPRGMPEIHIEGYWTWQQGISPTGGSVPLIIHANGFNVGDADAREVTASANLYYSGREICWKTVYFGTLAAGGRSETDTMVTCPLPSGFASGDLTIRFENVVVTP